MSLPAFLVPDSRISADGTGPSIDVNGPATVELTLGILDAVEQESLDVVIHGSADGAAWSPKPLISFPQKFYPGMSTLLLDLGQHPDVRHLRAQWKVNRWGHWKDHPPMFRFFVFAAPADK